MRRCHGIYLFRCWHFRALQHILRCHIHVRAHAQTILILVCRDIFTVRLTPSTQIAEAQRSLDACAPYMCPVTNLSCLKYPMAALPDCGHAFSSRALAQVCLSHLARGSLSHNEEQSVTAAGLQITQGSTLGLLCLGVTLLGSSC